MRQKSIGEVLRVARESHGWSLVDIQRMTNIQVQYVQALEYNDFDSIPDQIYTRSFLQRYAEVLDLDVSVILDAYDTDKLVVYYEVNEDIDPSKELRRNVKNKTKSNSYLPLFYLLLAAIFIFIFITYIVASRVQNQATSPSSTSYSVVSETSANLSSTEKEADDSSAVPSGSQLATATLNVTGSGENLAVTVSGTQAPIEVNLSVTTATSWISLTDTDIATGVVLSPENTSVTTVIPEGVTSTTLTLGVVQGVTVTIAGQNLDTSALTSQTGYITLTIE